VLETAGTPIAVATSSTRDYAEMVLTRLGIQRCFRFVLTAEDIRRGKPEPDIYLLAANRLSLATGQVMVLEDSRNGCRAAVSAGTYAVAVPNRHTLGHDFTGARFIADTLADPRIRQALAVSR
jgi:HAD superfamily hydrolase (TIGR01509 family)